VFSIFGKGGRSGKLDRLVDGLGVRGLAGFVDVDVRIVRGLAYYTGTVFEVFDRAGKLRAIAGGGRYDNLIGQLSEGAVSMPALGFAMGDVVPGELLRDRAAAREKLEAGVKEQNKIDIYVVIAKEQRRPDALEEIQELRDRGYRVDYPLTSDKVPKQCQTAEYLGSRITQVVFRPEENAQLAKEAHGLRSEDVIQVSGKVAARVPGTENSKLATGEIELIPSQLRILNRAADLPFPIDAEIHNEDLRLT